MSSPRRAAERNRVCARVPGTAWATVLGLALERGLHIGIESAGAGRQRDRWLGRRGGGGERGEQPVGQGDRVERADDPVPAGLTVDPAHGAGGDDRPACGAGVDLPAQARAAVAQFRVRVGRGSSGAPPEGVAYGVGVDRIGLPGPIGEDAPARRGRGDTESAHGRGWLAVAGVQVEHHQPERADRRCRCCTACAATSG